MFPGSAKRGPKGVFIGRNFPAGEYTLTATPYQERNKAGKAGTPVTISFTVVDGANIHAALSVYPVPTSGLVHVSYQGKVESANLMLLDFTGQSLLTLPLKEHVQLDLSAYRKGIYYLKVVSPEKVQVIRIVLEY